MKKFRQGCTTLAFFVASLAPLQANAASDTDKLLSQALFAPRHTSYIAQVENIRFGSHATNSILVRVEHQAPDLTRRSYLAPEKFFGNSVVHIGEHFYEFDVHRRRLILRKRDDRDDLSIVQNFALLSRNYRAVQGSESTIAGTKAKSLALLNRRSGRKVLTIWFDERTHLIVAREGFDSDGSVVSHMRFDTLRYTNDIPRTIFATSAPRGYTVVDQTHRQAPHRALHETIAHAPFAAVQPTELPDGFELVGASMPMLRGISMLHLLYSDGIRSLSVFENNKDSALGSRGYVTQDAKLDGHAAKIITDGANSLLSWRNSNAITFTLVGDLTDPEMLKIADSLR
jgi:negative regulator of sigma E activity